MRYYRCKCGKKESVGSMPPAPCRGCPECGTNLSDSPDRHREPEPCEFRTRMVTTDLGDMPLTECVWCWRRDDGDGA